MTKNAHKNPHKRGKYPKQTQHNSCYPVPLNVSENTLKRVFLVSITYNCPRRIQCYSHAQTSKNVLGFSAQVRICQQLSLAGCYHYRLFQGILHDVTGGEGGYFSPFQSMWRINTKASGHDQCAGTVRSSSSRKVPQLPPVTHFLSLL